MIFVFFAFGVVVTDTSLTASMQVATLSGGKLVAPLDAKSIILEIGMSDRNTADDELLPKYPTSFLVSFEPLLDKFAVNLAKGTKRFHGNKKDAAVPLGFHHRRGIILPLAVTEKGGPVTFHVSKVAGCSSVLPMNKKTTWGRFCLNALENRTVDSVSFDTLISLLPNLPIDVMKVDMQGLDGLFVTSLPDSILARTEKVIFEATSPACTALYIGQITCDKVENFLKSKGFSGTCGRRCEVTPTFVRQPIGSK